MADPKREPDDKEQSKRFIEKAREVAGEDANEAFERALKVSLRPSGSKSDRK